MILAFRIIGSRIMPWSVLGAVAASVALLLLHRCTGDSTFGSFGAWRQGGATYYGTDAWSVLFSNIFENGNGNDAGPVAIYRGRCEMPGWDLGAQDRRRRATHHVISGSWLGLSRLGSLAITMASS